MKITGFVPRTVDKFRVNSLYTFDKGKNHVILKRTIGRRGHLW